MTKKYEYTIERSPNYGDIIFGRYFWRVIFDKKYHDRYYGYAHTYAGAMKRIKKAIVKYEKAKAKGEILHVEGKVSGT